MSTACFSYAVIGCQVPREKLFKTKIVRVPHKHVTHDSDNYCPACGEVLTAGEEEEIDIDDKIGEFELVWSTDQEEAFIGKIVEASGIGVLASAPTFIENPNIPDIRCDLREVLKSLGMWDKNKFGLYAVQYISY